MNMWPDIALYWQGRPYIYYFIDRLMDGVFETFEYSKSQDVDETIAATCLSIFIAPAHMKKQHTAQLGYFSLPGRCCHAWAAGRIFERSQGRSMERE